MRALRCATQPADFFRRLPHAPRRALLLDYDGTLAPFRVDPKQATPYPGVRAALDALMTAGHTRVVIVSGRWTKDLVPLLGLARRPELWGSHGWEQLTAEGDYTVARIGKDALQQLVDADRWTAEIEALGGRCELKPASLAIHWRGLPDERVAAIRETVLANWRLHELHVSLAWQDFDGGIELRAPGRGKADVVAALLAELGAEAAVAYLGDDVTDEDAFKALAGRGLGVLVRAQFRPTAADAWIRPPEELLEFLMEWQRLCEAAP